MAIDPITAALDVGKVLIEKIWPNVVDQAREIRLLEELHQKGDLAELNAKVSLLVGQIEINKIDAGSGNWFQSNWRPSIGWVGSLSLALMYIPKSIVMTYIWTFQAITILNGWDGAAALAIPSFPDLGVSDIIGLLMSLLGVAAMRSYDKKNSVDTK